MERWIKIAEEITRGLESGARLITVFAPTSYGKTLSSPHVLKMSRESRLASRLIHVVPTRALLRQIYNEKFREASSRLRVRVSYQSHDMIPGGVKSPYFLSELVVTTLESFILNAYKLQPSELSKLIDGLSEGHYYPAFSSIATSITVFDEAHLYVGESSYVSSPELVVSAISALQVMSVPCVLMTATLPTILLENLARESGARDNLRVIYVCGSSSGCEQVERLREKGFKVDVIDAEPSWRTPSWHTEVISPAGADKIVVERCKSRLVLYVLNSVERAVEAYERLKSECGEERTVIVHGRLTERDKDGAEEKVRKLRGDKAGLIIASPIVEVGVDIDADTLITEPAPLENIVQRAGRLCRSQCEEGEVFLINNTDLAGSYDGELTKRTIEAIDKQLKEERSIEWRSLWDTNSGRSYASLLEELASENQRYYSVRSYKVFQGIVKEDSRPLAYIREISAQLKGLALFKILPLEAREGSKDVLEHDYILGDLDLLIEIHRDNCIEIGGGDGGESVQVLLVIAEGERRGKEYEFEVIGSKSLYKLISSRRRGKQGALADYWDHPVFSLRREMKCYLLERRGGRQLLLDYYILVKKDCYKRGVGLVGKHVASSSA